MKTGIIFFLFMSFSLISFSQSHKDFEKERELYKNNKVKTKLCYYDFYSENIYYDSDGKPVLKENFDRSSNKMYEVEFIYDAQNNLTEEVGFIINNNSRTPDNESKITHEYDNNGNRIKTWENEFNIDYVYDSNGLLIESYENGLGETSKLTYRYNDLGLLKVIKIEYTDGTKEIREHVYYDNDYIQESNFYKADDKWRVSRAYNILYFTYDSNNNLIKVTNREKNFFEEYAYEYYE